MRLTDPVATALWSRLQAFELDPPSLTRTISARIAEDNGWAAEHTRRVVEEYRRFLLLTQVAGRPVSPSAVVDVVWHTHLLYSRDYWERLCGQVLGGPLHHDPNPGGEQGNVRQRDQYRDTLDDYARVFGEAPPADLWPTTQTPPTSPAPQPATPGTLGEYHQMLTRLLSGGYRPTLLAFLCGKDARVTATALAGLHQRGLVGFAAGRPVLDDRVPAQTEGLSPEEWKVWHALRRLTDLGEPVKLPLSLSYPELEVEAIGLDLWPSPDGRKQEAADARRAFLRSVPLWLAVGGAVALYATGFKILAALVLLTRIPSAMRAFVRWSVEPTVRGRHLVTEFKRLVPGSASVRLGSPLLTAVVAAGGIGAATASDLAALQSAIDPRSGSSGGGGCGGGDGGGCGGGGD